MSTPISPQLTTLFAAMKKELLTDDSSTKSNAANAIKDITQNDTSAENAKPLSEFLSDQHTSNAKSDNTKNLFEGSISDLGALNTNSRKNNISLNDEKSSSRDLQLDLDYKEALHLLKHGATKKDKKSGKKLLLQTADLGHAEAAMNCALFFHQKSNGFPRDNTRTYKYAKLSKEHGSKIVLGLLGFCCQYGLGTTINIRRAERYYTKSINNSDRSLDTIYFKLYLCKLYVENKDIFFPEKMACFQEYIELVIANKDDLCKKTFGHLLVMQCKGYLCGIGFDKNITKGLQFGSRAISHSGLNPHRKNELRLLMKKYR